MMCDRARCTYVPNGCRGGGGGGGGGGDLGVGYDDDSDHDNCDHA